MAELRRQLVVMALVASALTAGVTSAIGLHVNVRTAAASSVVAESLARQAEKLDQLAYQLEQLRHSCGAASSALSRLHSNSAAPPGTVAAQRVDELASAVAERLRPPQEPESPPRNSESIAALDAATRQFEGAVARKRWTDNDVTAMQAVVDRLHPEDLVELRRQLSVAINHGDVSLETREFF